jgi:hypothetical protein
VEVDKSDALTSEGIDVRRVDFTTERAKVGGTHIVDDDEQDVGSLISDGSVPSSRRSSAGTNREEDEGRTDGLEGGSSHDGLLLLGLTQGSHAPISMDSR